MRTFGRVHDDPTSNRIQSMPKYVVDFGHAIVGGAESGLCSGLSGRGLDVVSLPWLLQTIQNEVAFLRPHQHCPLHNGRGLPVDDPLG